MTLAEIHKRLPPGRNGKPIALSTLYRWADGGVRGVRLETISFGGTRMSSLDAVRRFIGTLSPGAEVIKVRTEREVVGATQRSDAELESSGW